VFYYLFIYFRQTYIHCNAEVSIFSSLMLVLQKGLRAKINYRFGNTLIGSHWLILVYVLAKHDLKMSIF